MRKNIKFGDLNSIEGIMNNHGASSEGEHSEEAFKELKKPRLGKSSETHGEVNDIEGLEKENIIVGDTTNNYEELSEGKGGDKDQTEGSVEKDKIMQVLLDMHEDVPLEDPGPNIESEDREEGNTGTTQ